MENIDPRILAVTLLIIILSTLVLLKKKPKELLKVDIDDLINDADETWNSAQGDHKSNSDYQDQDLKQGDENDKHIKAQEQTQTQTKLKNVFDVKQPPPNVGNPQPQPQRTSKTTSTEKPFKSSYYYAHNQMKKTGGYTDGLKAEDYVMNGPKLLSKGKSTLASSSGEGTGTGTGTGTDVETNSKSDAGYTRTSTPATTTISTTMTSAQAATKNGAGNSIPINRYLWDDDGNEKRLAKIYIDTLPGKVGKSPLPVQEASITKEDVVCKLVGEAGLMIQIRRKDTDADGDGDENSYARYHLYIPCMHGEVEDVKTIVKAKKVIVKLTKKKTKGNAKAWPQLPSKVVKSTPDGVDYANEDLFLPSS